MRVVICVAIFGGGGNYDGVVSEPVSVDARPGFILSPEVIDPGQSNRAFNENTSLWHDASFYTIIAFK